MATISSVVDKTNRHLLDVKNLTTKIKTSEGVLTVLEDVNLTIKKGEMMAIVGESGSGKSMTINSILRLIPKNLLQSYEGTVEVENTELISLKERDMKQIRGKKISLIAQNAMTSLDPSYRIGSQIIEIIVAKTSLTKANAKEKALTLLEQMGIHDPKLVYNSYPHQLSGGLRQRAVIAMSLACDPDLIIADEPTSALDPTVQLQVLDLLKKINAELGTAVLMITHDFGVVARIAEKVAVMYAGQIVEKGLTSDVIYKPKHPYTKSLLKCIPDLSWIFDESKTKESLWQIPGEPPNLLNGIQGCRFAARCSQVVNQCRSTDVLLQKVSKTKSEHLVRCIQSEGVD
jgi:oligopeptide/dipeptide ABC transporter ATP-binding protein